MNTFIIYFNVQIKCKSVNSYCVKKDTTFRFLLQNYLHAFQIAFRDGWEAIVDLIQRELGFFSCKYDLEK